MSKQTAVKWLFHKLWDEPKDKFTWYSILKQAEEMEQEQIENAYQAGDGDAYNLEETKMWAEEYYKETYGGGE